MLHRIWSRLRILWILTGRDGRRSNGLDYGFSVGNVHSQYLVCESVARPAWRVSNVSFSAL